MHDDGVVLSYGWSGVDQLASSSNLPWLVPGIGIALVVSVAASGRVARWLGVTRVAAWVLLMSTGVILSATLTPQALEARGDPGLGRLCELTRIGPPGLAELSSSPVVEGNILMFIPLGFAIAVAPRSSHKRALLVGAFALPFLIEATQFVVTPLGRGCQSADVTDNLTGLVLGLALGALTARLAPRLVRKSTNHSP